MEILYINIIQRKVLVLIMVFLLFITNEPVMASESYNYNSEPVEIDLYALPDRYKEAISIPADYKQEYQISDGKDARYSILYGGSVIISKDGHIKPHEKVYYLDKNGNYTDDPEKGRKVISYKYGPTFIQVDKGKQSYKIIVNLKNYAKTYTEKVLNQYIEEHIKENMSDREKLEIIAQFPCQYDYGSGACLEDMVIFGHGDCWASTEAIVGLSKKLGFKARNRDAHLDSGAGNGHQNAVVKVEGTDYVVEAGYDQMAPRDYSIWEGTEYIYDVKEKDQTVSLRQYDGIGDNIEVPDMIDGYKVSEIGAYCFVGAMEVKSVRIPEGIKKIGNYAFWNSEIRTVKIPQGVEEIGQNAFGFSWDFINKDGAKVGIIKEPEMIELPDSIQKIGVNLSNSVVLYHGTAEQWKQVQFVEKNMAPSNENLFCLTNGLEVSQNKLELQCGQTQNIKIYDLNANVKVSGGVSDVVSTKITNEIEDEQISENGTKKQLFHAYKTLEIKAIKEGEDILTVSDGRNSSKIDIHILPKKQQTKSNGKDSENNTINQKVRIIGAPKILKAGKRITLKAVIIKDRKATNISVKWLSSNTKYAIINKNGGLTILEAGKGKKVTITAIPTDGTIKRASVKIKIK